MIKNESQLKGRIISMLRRLSWQWEPRSQALRNAKCGQQGRAFIYKCAICGGSFKKDDVAIDHIDPVVPLNGFENGKSWDYHEYILRLFCEIEGFRVLCDPCHDKVTENQKEERRKFRAETYKKKKTVKKKKVAKKKAVKKKVK
jgi:5-methylcytosine-specific restriction endonuclease McrA